MRSVDEQVAILMQGAEFGDEQTHKHMEQELRERLNEGRPLRVYCGYDPSAPDIHLGHTVTMRKLREFQDLGHDVTFLIGTMTGMVGDPSDQDSARAQKTLDQVMENARTYTEQAFQVLDREKTKVRYNHEWLQKLSFNDLIELASKFTVQQFLARDNFSQRHASGDAIWLHEFFYALMQGYDAVAQETDVQLGATEQLFNLFAGRKLQELYGQRPQVCLTFPILVGTDGKERMSKSRGNYIGVSEPPDQQFGKIMSLPDEVMGQFFRLVTRYTPDQISAIEDGLEADKLHPRDVKMQLAREIVSMYHSEDAAARAQEGFEQVFQRRELPSDMPEFASAEPMNLVDVISAAGLVKSKSEARRLIQQNAVSIDGEKIQSIDYDIEFARGQVLRVGRRRFLRLLPG